MLIRLSLLSPLLGLDPGVWEEANHTHPLCSHYTSLNTASQTCPGVYLFSTSIQPW